MSCVYSVQVTLQKSFPLRHTKLYEASYAYTPRTVKRNRVYLLAENKTVGVN